MNRAEIIEIMKSFDFDKSEYIISTGAAMVLHGVREQTHDIDLGCTKALSDKLIALGCDYITYPDGGRKISFSEDIEVSEFLYGGSAVTLYGLPVADLDTIIVTKRRLGREKDFRDIALIEQFRAAGETK